MHLGTLTGGTCKTLRLSVCFPQPLVAKVIQARLSDAVLILVATLRSSAS